MRLTANPHAAPQSGWRQSLRRRYALTFVALVSLPLLLSAAVSASITWRQQQQALAAVQSAQVAASAERIGQFLHEVELQLRGLALLPWAGDSASQRRLNAVRAKIPLPLHGEHIR